MTNIPVTREFPKLTGQVSLEGVRSEDRPFHVSVEVPTTLLLHFRHEEGGYYTVTIQAHVDLINNKIKLSATGESGVTVNLTYELE